ncbi:MAG: M15 family metallopeptidase [Lachnospiraceae bacterium]|nr:M15 family metallopeptidase [Lachnospiraceae bacterium]
MISEVQSKHIKRYQKFAKKNIVCKYIATVMIVISVFARTLFRFQKRNLVVGMQLIVIGLVFFMNASFAPPSFQESLQETDIITDSEDIQQEYDTEQQVELTEYPQESDGANLDDLMAQTVHLDTTKQEQKDGELFHKDDWNLLLVNKQHPIPEDYTFSLGTIKGSMQCDERIIEPLTEMFAAAKEEGINLEVRSPYRDISRQEYLFDRKMKTFMNKGYSYMDAYKTASITVTVPGASEHQIGLAVDITCDTYAALDEGFENTDAGRWLAHHSSEYGFILRYPRGKEEITGIQYEPWHYRYVGKEAATIIMNENITLEEFVENL